MIEDVIVDLNRLKITKPCNDPEITAALNDMQRRLEVAAGVTAVELDPKYE